MYDKSIYTTSVWGIIYPQLQFFTRNYDSIHPPPVIAKNVTAIGFLFFSILAIAPAQAVVIDFESLANSGSSTYPLNSSSYTENGFTMTIFSAGFNPYIAWGSAAPYYPGSTALGHSYQNETTTLTQVGGGTFTLTSIDLADLYNADQSTYGNGTVPIPVTVNFIGNLVGGGIVTQSFTTDSSPGLETFNFTNFTNLASVQWTPTAGSFPNIQFDNINVTPLSSTSVPEPFTVLGTLVGAGASVALKRKLARRNDNRQNNR